MRIPLAPAGLREMAILSAVFGGLAAVMLSLGLGGHAWAWPVLALFVAAWLGSLAFFRDPERQTPSGTAIMVSPADGKVTEITRLDHHPDVGGPATRIGIFLSVFDVHINRSPCGGAVRSISYKAGKFLDARDVNSGHLNEANTIVIDPDAPHAGPVVVRQVAGTIARRIVCSVKPGDRLALGQRVGLIKFGSRTELILPGHNLYEPTIAVGDRVKGALSVLARRLSEEESARAAALDREEDIASRNIPASGATEFDHAQTRS
jgi:phosphatidylserine decarboxylase